MGEKKRRSPPRQADLASPQVTRASSRETNGEHEPRTSPQSSPSSDDSRVMSTPDLAISPAHGADAYPAHMQLRDAEAPVAADLPSASPPIPRFVSPAPAVAPVSSSPPPARLGGGTLESMSTEIPFTSPAAGAAASGFTQSLLGMPFARASASAVLAAAPSAHSIECELDARIAAQAEHQRVAAAQLRARATTAAAAADKAPAAAAASGGVASPSPLRAKAGETKAQLRERQRQVKAKKAEMAKAAMWTGGPVLPILTRQWWERAAQYFCVTCCVYCLPACMLFTLFLYAFTTFVAAWVLLESSGVSQCLLDTCGGVAETTIRSVVAAGLDLCVYLFGQVALIGHGNAAVEWLHAMVERRGGYRNTFWGLAVIYLLFATAYFAHIRLDRRYMRAATGRSDVLRKTAWFRRFIRGYFPAEIYVDSSVGSFDRRLSWTRLDGPASAQTEEAILAAIKLYPTTTTELGAGLRGATGATPTTSEPERYLFCCHPHGLFTFSVWCTFNAWTRAMAKIFDERGFITTVHTLAVNFQFPVWREMLLDFRFSDASRATLLRALGGAKAALFLTPEEHKAAIRSANALKLARIARGRRSHPNESDDASSTSPLKRGGSDAGGSNNGSACAEEDTEAAAARRRKREAAAKRKAIEVKRQRSYAVDAEREAGRPRMSVLVPGGAEESVNCTEPRLTLKKRKGFVKIALTTGAQLVPVYTFGETDLYRPMIKHPFVARALIRLEKLTGVGTPLVVGEHFVNLFAPRRHRLRTVLGKPIDTRRFWRVAVDDAGAAAGIARGDRFFTDADVDRLHGEYVDALRELYRKYQPKLDPTGPRELAFDE